MTNVAEEEVESKKRLLDRVRQGLGKTRSQLISGLEGLFLGEKVIDQDIICLLYTSPSPRDRTRSRMPSSA